MLIDTVLSALDPTPLAALPPHHQEAIEKKAIIGDPHLAALLQEDEVREIQKTDIGYQIFTQHGQQIEVHVTYLPAGIGPAKFSLSFKKIQQTHRSSSAKSLLRQAKYETQAIEKAIQAAMQQGLPQN